MGMVGDAGNVAYKNSPDWGRVRGFQGTKAASLGACHRYLDPPDALMAALRLD